MGSSPYYSHTTPIRIPKDMGIVWETYHKGVPLLKVPENIIDLFQGGKIVFFPGKTPPIFQGNPHQPSGAGRSYLILTKK